MPGERRLCSSSIAPPLELSVTEEELRLLRSVVPGRLSAAQHEQISHQPVINIFKPLIKGWFPQLKMDSWLVYCLSKGNTCLGDSKHVSLPSR